MELIYGPFPALLLQELRGGDRTYLRNHISDQRQAMLGSRQVWRLKSSLQQVSKCVSAN